MSVFEILEREPDLHVITDPSGRARIWEADAPWKIVHRATGIVMFLCPEGEFWMGSPPGDRGSAPDEIRHHRAMRVPFYLSQTAVTQAQWTRIAGRNPSFFQNQPDLPVEQVSWSDCCAALRSIEGGLRLPSEAEWEYACRAGTSTAYAFGGEVSEQQVCFNKWDGPAACGSLPPNPWGFHEMHGNVWEWCEDPYAAYRVEGGTEQPATGVGTSIRVLRGGSWLSHRRACRSSQRCSSASLNRFNGVGLRVARTLDDSLRALLQTD